MDYHARSILEQVLLVFATLFPVINPIGGAPVFLAMTRNVTDEQRAMLARRVGVNALMLLAGSFLIGSHVIDFFGLSVPIIQVGGGMMVIAIAWRILNSDSDPDAVPIEKQSPAALAARAFYPLTMPLTVGPGSIAVAITLGAHVPRGVRAWAHDLAASLIGAVLLALSIYLLYRYADRLIRALGETGTQILLRLTAFILLCIGVNIVWSGAFALIQTIPSYRVR